MAATGVAAGTALGVTVVGALGPDDTTAGTPVSQDTVDQAIQRWQDGAAAEPGLDPFGSSGQPYVDGGTSSGSTDSGRTWIVPGGSTSGRADTRTQGSPG